MVTRRSYRIDSIKVNGVQVNKVIIDPHYEEKHADHMNDQLILKLVQKLDGRFELPDSKVKPYAYFATLIELDSNHYRLVWLLEDGTIYIGVVNAFRDRKRG